MGDVVSLYEKIIFLMKDGDPFVKSNLPMLLHREQGTHYGKSVDSNSKHPDFLSLCCYCNKINVIPDLFEENDSWISREDCPKLYDLFLEHYSESISHGACPRCYGRETLLYG